MRIERVLTILCGVILLTTVLAVSLPPQTTLAVRDKLAFALDDEASVVDGPTFDSHILFPAVFKSRIHP